MSDSFSPRVLIVDDEPMVLRTLQQIVVAWARKQQDLPFLNMETHSNGASALEAARKDPTPVFILSDTHMPVMSGLGLLRAVREFSQVPFLLIGGKGLTAAETEEVARLNATYLAKPVELETIAAKLTEAFFPTPPVQPPRRYVCVVADDDSDFRESLADLLTDLGFEVLEARDGTETLAYCRSRAVDFVISDFEMGELDGVRCLIKLRQEDLLMPYLVLSGRNNPDVIALIAKNSGAYRQKPPDHNAIEAWLRTFNFLPEAS